MGKIPHNKAHDPERLYRALFEHASDAILIFEPKDEIILDANRQALKLYGFKRSEFVGRSLITISAHPASGRRRVRETLRLGRLPMFESVQYRKDGTPLALAISASVVDYKGRRAILSINRDVTAAKAAEVVLKDSPRRIIEAQEAERRRVARELHDSVSQLLASARYRLHALEEGLPPEHRVLAAGAQDAVERALSEVRRISHGLRPRELDDLGLAAALRMLVADFEARTGLVVTVRGAQLEPRLSSDREEACYRIVQEALTNIERHAHARRVTLQLTRSRSAVRLVIRDDGHGIAHDRQAGLGLMHMRERAEQLGGTWQIGPARGRGTEIVARLPLAPEGA